MAIPGSRHACNIEGLSFGTDILKGTVVHERGLEKERDVISIPNDSPSMFSNCTHDITQLLPFYAACI